MSPSHLRRDFDAQWNDDGHHVLHVMLTGESEGYYGDYADRPAERLARSLREGFVYQGDPSRHRNGEPRGTPSADLPPTAFVLFLQNHDQIGNRAFGDRLTASVAPRALRSRDRAAAALPADPAAVHGRGGRLHGAVPVLHRPSRRTRRRGARRSPPRVRELCGVLRSGAPRADPRPERGRDVSALLPDSARGARRPAPRFLSPAPRPAARASRAAPRRRQGTRSGTDRAVRGAGALAAWRWCGVDARQQPRRRALPARTPGRRRDLRNRECGRDIGERPRSPVTRPSPSWSRPVDEAIRELAREAGIANDWIDAAGVPRRVAIEPLRSILAALGLPAASEADIAASRARLRERGAGARFRYCDDRRADRVDRPGRQELAGGTVARDRREQHAHDQGDARQGDRAAAARRPATIACASRTARSRWRSRRRAA